MKNLENDVAAWIATEPTVTVEPGEGEAHLLNNILADFWTAYPVHETAHGGARETQLNLIANACGLRHYARLPGKAICEANGGRTLRLRVGM